MNREQANQTVQDVFFLYEKYGSADYIGEPVSQIEHMCQAAQLAEDEGYDDEIVLAAFFHDIGHLYEHVEEVQLMNGYGVERHEELGYDYLKRKGFSERIASLVESHVPAKRYLTCKFPEYYNTLSDASRYTLEQQGGVMSEAEALAFELDPLFELYIKIRKWDDLAKETGVAVPSLQKYKDMALSHLLKQK